MATIYRETVADAWARAAEERRRKMSEQVAGCLKLDRQKRYAALQDLVRSAFNDGQGYLGEVYLGRLSVALETWPEHQLEMTRDEINSHLENRKCSARSKRLEQDLNADHQAQVEAATKPTAASLAREIFQVLVHETETFREDNVGADLAYLMGAILDPSGEEFVDWRPCSCPQAPTLLTLLREHFDATHSLWSHIKT